MEKFLIGFNGFVVRHKRAVSLLVLALLLVTVSATAVHATDPTDAAGVIDAGQAFVADYTMYITAGAIVGIGLFIVGGLLRKLRRG